MQMVNHGLVVAPLFFIIGVLAGARRRLATRSSGWAAWRSARPCSPRCS